LALRDVEEPSRISGDHCSKLIESGRPQRPTL